MINNFTGGGLINYGSALPGAALDGALFYKTDASGGIDPGLYVFSFVQDGSVNLGDQVQQNWVSTLATDRFVLKAGSVMTGQLEIPGFLRVTETSPAQRILLGNQDNAGLNAPVILNSHDGVLTIGHGSTWTGNGGTLTPIVSINTVTGAFTIPGGQVWTSANDGVGSGLDADLLAGHASSYYLNASNISAGTLDVSHLPFTPVQQGGGTGQGNSKVYIGNGGVNRLYLEVGSTDYSDTWPININGTATSATSAGTATTAGSATEAVNTQYVRQNGGTSGTPMVFNYNATAGQPTYVWGTNDGITNATYNPANFSAASVTTTDDTTTNAAFDITFVSTVGAAPLKVSSTKLTFNPSTGGLTVSGSAFVNGGNEVGYKDVPLNTQSAAYVASTADRGKIISISTGGVTVPSGVFSAGHTFLIYNNSSSSQTITQGSGVTMYIAGTATTGNRTLAQRGVASVLCVGTNTFVINGGGLT